MKVCFLFVSPVKYLEVWEQNKKYNYILLKKNHSKTLHEIHASLTTSGCMNHRGS